MMYDFRGNTTVGYDFDGNPLKSATPPAIEGTNAFERAFLDAKSEWESDYRQKGVIPFIVTADQHGYMTESKKDVFGFVKKTVRWDEISAFFNLGDTVSGSWGDNAGNVFKALQVLPKEKVLAVMGNHDAWTPNPNGEESVRLPTAEETIERKNALFDNRGYWNGCQRAGNLVETVVDPVHKARYVMVDPWVDGYGTYGFDKYTTETIDGFINFLSIADDNDVVMVSHIIPVWGGDAVDVYTTTFDGSEMPVSHRVIKTYGLKIGLQDIMRARVEKTSGTFTDEDGVVHNFDFSGCTSDFRCSIHGHEHSDFWTDGAGIPSIVFDNLYRTPYPIFLVNVHSDKVKIWQVKGMGTEYTGTEEMIGRVTIPINA